MKLVFLVIPPLLREQPWATVLISYSQKAVKQQLAVMIGTGFFSVFLCMIWGSGNEEGNAGMDSNPI
jgi:hypothetical protein